MKGEITGISQVDLPDGRRYLSISIDGESGYSLWDKAYFEQLKVGDKIEYDFKDSGKFKNITALELLPKTPNSNNQIAQRDMHIIRMSSLKSASEIVSTIPTDYKNKVKLTLDSARVFESYVLGENTVKNRRNARNKEDKEES